MNLERPEQECILYSDERRKEAFGLARELRDEGRSVVLQSLRGVSDVDEYTKLFNSVHYCIGAGGKGGGIR